MNKPVIITISRQYGSNGQEIGRRLAEYLDIAYYNKDIMEKVAENMGINSQFFKEDNQNESGMYSINRKVGRFTSIAELSVNSQMFSQAEELIQGIAKRESAVIVGRAADYILKDNPDCISVFCYSSLEDRIKWSILKYNVPIKQARKIVEDKDQLRARFYEFYTNQKWGDSRNYSLLINTTKMTTEEVVKLLAAIYDQKVGYQTIKNNEEE